MTLALNPEARSGPLRECEVPKAQSAASRAKQINAFSVDVEDYFQVEAFKTVVNRGSWDSQSPRIMESTERVADLLDAAGVQATFFVLGWVAERFPSLVRHIQKRGHEIASHGCEHQLVWTMSPDQFRQDVRRARGLLEDCIGNRVRGFRAPTFSIRHENWWAYDILAEEGYEYSSSVYPIAHDLYGIPKGPRGPFRPIANAKFVEIPIATVRLFGGNRPCGGGGYFRLMPYRLSRWCINRVNEVDQMACVFYCHPWEFDPDQPRLQGLALKSRIRHYLNIGAMERRVGRLLRDFRWGRIDEIFLAERALPVNEWTG